MPEMLERLSGLGGIEECLSGLGHIISHRDGRYAAARGRYPSRRDTTEIHVKRDKYPRLQYVGEGALSQDIPGYRVRRKIAAESRGQVESESGRTRMSG